MLLNQPYTLKNMQLPHRVVMAPMTRARSSQPGNVPNELMATYYAQRAPHAALIVSEASQISPQGQGYSYTPGIHSTEQIKGWKLVTQAVHKEGGKIFLQLWHVGRMSHESFHGGERPVGPSALAPDATVWVANDEHPNGTMLPCPVPRALTIEEIHQIIDDFRQAAANAIEAGFDGVEIHGANGYLFDQFLRRSSNKRDDEYGGVIENRVRFMVDVTKAIVDEIGPERTGIRVAPFIQQRGMDDSEAIDAVLLAAQSFEALGIAYVHLVEADWADAPQIPDDFRQQLRDVYSGTIIVAGNYTLEKAEHILGKGWTDLVAFGRPFISNVDVPERLFEGRELTELDSATLFGGGAKGYTDYI